VIAPAVYGSLTKWTHSVGRRLKVTDEFQFEDCRRASNMLVCMLAGYKPELWRFVMPRFKHAVPDGDVCLLSPRMRIGELSDLSRNTQASGPSSTDAPICSQHNHFGRCINMRKPECRGGEAMSNSYLVASR
jgi:hypothetical protein